MNCQTCKYFSLDGCAVNPAYREMRSKLSKSDAAFIKAIKPYLQPCPDWQEAQLKTISLTLPEHYWSVVTSNSNSAIAAAMAKELEQLIRQELGLPKPTNNGYDDLPF